MILYDEIKELSDGYELRLRQQMDTRIIEMEADDFSHHILYRVLGVCPEEGHQIDVMQNKGRFLYRYAGSFLEDAAFLCIKHSHPEAEKKRIPNTNGVRPKTFEIDALVGNDAFEIKWRDATTDGDHITKEHTRLKTIHDAGYRPVRLMFYYPNRTQAQRIQRVLQDLYGGLGGGYYYGDTAWSYLREYTGHDLFRIIQQIAIEKTGNAS